MSRLTNHLFTALTSGSDAGEVKWASAHSDTPGGHELTQEAWVTDTSISWSECPESVSGHDIGGTTDGSCAWCGRRIDQPRPRPRLPFGYVTELDEAYGRHWDPDWGT